MLFPSVFPCSSYSSSHALVPCSMMCSMMCLVITHLTFALATASDHSELKPNLYLSPDTLQSSTEEDTPHLEHVHVVLKRLKNLGRRLQNANQHLRDPSVIQMMQTNKQGTENRIEGATRN